jgi:glucose-6-phosphate isomerase
MQLTFSDEKRVSKIGMARGVKQLRSFDAAFTAQLEKPQADTPAAAVLSWKDETQLTAVNDVVAKFKKPKHVVLIGIGGSSLGAEAIHAALATSTSPQLHILDTIAPHELESILTALSKVKKAADIAVCVVSKSGSTVETLANAEVVIGALEKQLGKAIWQQVVCIGNPDTDFMQLAQKRKAHAVPMPEIVGGRYSVFTSVGLVPLALLGHDTEAILAGVEDATTMSYRTIAYENAVRLHLHLKSGVWHYNFFAFDTRLVRLGKWYRQLTAESLGKEKTRKGKKVKLGFLPTISTAVDLHSIGQLYFAQFPGVYTDFVTFRDTSVDYQVPKKPKLATKLAGQTQQDIAAAIYDGVVEAYQMRQLPYRSTIFDEGLDYSLGLFMATRMLETMALAELLDINAFDQPNVELYKNNTRKILGF